MRVLIEEIQKARNSIEAEFPGIVASQEKVETQTNGQVFLNSTEEARFATRVARAILGTGNFTMSFGGMSDAAGHGNFVEGQLPSCVS